VTVKLGLIKLLQKRFDLCEEAYVVLSFLPYGQLTSLRRNANATVQCPVEPGSYHVTHTVALPKEIPPGELVNPSLLEQSPHASLFSQIHHQRSRIHCR